MGEFFRRWRAFSNWAAAWLAFACALVSVLGGAQMIAAARAPWIGWVFVAFGLGLMAALEIGRRRGSSS